MPTIASFIESVRSRAAMTVYRFFRPMTVHFYILSAVIFYFVASPAPHRTSFAYLTTSHSHSFGNLYPCPTVPSVLSSFLHPPVIDHWTVARHVGGLPVVRDESRDHRQLLVRDDISGHVRPLTSPPRPIVVALLSPSSAIRPATWHRD